MPCLPDFAASSPSRPRERGQAAHGVCGRVRGLAIFALALAGSFALPHTMVAQAGARSGLAQRADYQAALKASRDGMHEVAAVKLARILEEPGLGKKEALALGERVVDAYLRARLPQQALEVLSKREIPEAAFWKGQAYLVQQKYREAEAELKAYLKSPARYAPQAHAALGQAIIGQGRENAGRKELKEVVGTADRSLSERAYVLSNESEAMSGRADIVLKRIGPDRGSLESEFVRACAYLETGEFKQAEITLRRFLDGSGPLPLRLHDAAYVRLAQAYALQGRALIAEKRLRAFIDMGVDSDYLEQAFALLLTVSTEDDDALLKSLTAWSTQPSPPGRQALALFHLGQWMAEHGRNETAIEHLESFRTRFPDHPRQGEALRSLMALYGAARADERVVELWQSRYGSAGPDIVDYLMGMVRFARGEHVAAREHFERSASLATDVVQARLALYNAGVSAFMGRDEKAWRWCLAQLQQPVPAAADGSPLPASASETAGEQAPRLLIEQALTLAARRDPGAEEALQKFLQEYPAHPRAVEAHVALAELAMLDLPARTRAAGAALDAAERIPGLAPEWKERLGYIRVWWHEAAGNIEGVISSGTDFLAAWKESDWRDEVRMKVAQACYRKEDFARAVTEFETLAQEHADSPYADMALFFAGKAAMSQLTPAGLNKAIELWNELVTSESPLAMEALRQQALAKRRQGNETDALRVIDTLLGTKPAPAGDERFDLLMEKGELLVLQARLDKKYLDEAASVFRGIVEDKEARYSWKQRAGVLLAQCHQQAGRTSAALETCFDVLEAGLSPQSVPLLTPQDRVWIFRAGFMAMELLEAQRQWEAAARLADRLAKIGGDRAEEAAARAERLRLEHLIWEK